MFLPDPSWASGEKLQVTIYNLPLATWQLVEREGIFYDLVSGKEPRRTVWQVICNWMHFGCVLWWRQVARWRAATWLELPKMWARLSVKERAFVAIKWRGFSKCVFLCACVGVCCILVSAVEMIFHWICLHFAPCSVRGRGWVILSKLVYAWPCQ